ncbi:hypothetical protein PIB30_013062 [Stylosanthes scabra]|uniref:Leucine-rich repeat-containing N-terminal plant-type domain-containing protein n=1 Tax=Stylosanthes scabra TaxID=79078 RepID=A0ABU6T7M5_9FABA|nr:hypothetical protein [Stylosanthes scabra]
MSNSKVLCNHKDMTTLLDFKQGIIDPSGSLSSWLAKQDCCQWKGVQCNNITGRVIELNLPCHTVPSTFSYIDDKSHCLTGEIHLSTLLDIEFLNYLNLSNNDFKIPQYNYYSMHSHICDNSKECGNFSMLNYLDLSYNYDLLVDNLNWISNFSSLQYLDLSGIDLHKETNHWLRLMTLLPSLSELYLSGCQLGNIYPSLQYANITSLKVLDFSDNDFVSTQFPIWVFNLSSDISHIDLSLNFLHGQLPKTLLNLQSLSFLDLSINNLDGPLSDWLGQIQQLKYLNLYHNSFSGSIPTNLGNLSSLTSLDLNSNNLDGDLPESLGNLFNLEGLNILDNLLTGNISERNFHSLSNLKELSFSSPTLTYDFDPKWNPPFQLEVLQFRFLGLPTWLYTQTSLKVLTIGNSMASFEPLDKFWKFAAQLEFLSLGNVSINADMSNVLLNSKVVWLEADNLRGGVPQLSPNVTFLTLYYDSLSGPLSPLLCQNMNGESNLKLLDIGSNMLSGEIPDCWMNWKSLLYVGLEGNNLTGKIPPSIGTLSNLIVLNLVNNKLFGEVPISLLNCKNLWILNLSGNKFSGTLPKWIGQSVKVLILRSNQFSGSIPTEICQLHWLKILDFAKNRLLGPIPDCLHNMTSMISKYASIDEFFITIPIWKTIQMFRFGLTLYTKGTEFSYVNSMYVIDLSNNSLSGMMPSELFSLARLQSLNLSHNQLTGMLSQEIGNLKQLESLDISSNQLSGQIPQSLSSLTFLGALNLSFNNFMGKIPSGTQLQGFTNLSYMGNPELCGPPLSKPCGPQDEEPHNSATQVGGGDDDDDDDKSWFYMGLGIGFATGFWGVLGTILFNRKCRHAYFRFLGQLHEMMMLKMNSISWHLRNFYRDN